MPAPGLKETGGAVHRSSDRLDPKFIRGLVDDEAWHERGNRPVRSRPPRKEQRSRLVAIIAFVVVAVLIIVIGVTAGGGDSGSPAGGQSTPFSILPLPGGPVTSTTETGTSSVFDGPSDMSTPLTTVPVAAVLGD